jgi:hypothetical protein
MDYAAILDAIEQFNTRLAADYERLDRIKRSLKGDREGKSL